MRVQDVYEDYAGRRQGIIKALTTDVEKFYALCDPNRENLTLFGFPDGTWAVDLPAEEVPPEVPEPALGINFARDGMDRKDWLSIVAVHSDSWLLATAFYKGARFNAQQRSELFNMINKLPTCFEVVSGRYKNSQPGSAGGGRRPPAFGGVQQHPQTMGGRGRSNMDEDADEMEEDDSGEGWADGEGEPCPICKRLYCQKEFWIACDSCDKWYCGKCTKMTQARADRIKSWHCPNCSDGGAF